MLQKFLWGFIILVFTLFGVVFSNVSDMKSIDAVLQYQNTDIQKRLDKVQKDLEILKGSQYELHSKMDKLIGGK